MRKPLLFAAVFLLAGCYYDKEEILYPGTVCDTANVSWTGSVKAIIDGNCATTGCHVAGGTGPGDFTQYANVKAQVDNGNFTSIVLVSKTMPPSFSLSSCQLEQLTIWVNNGATAD